MVLEVNITAPPTATPTAPPTASPTAPPATDSLGLAAAGRTHTIQLRGLNLGSRTPDVNITVVNPSGNTAAATWHIVRGRQHYLTEPDGTMVLELGAILDGTMQPQTTGAKAARRAAATTTATVRVVVHA
jgi:hypothetical protein